jgi:hypothetical protein
MTDVSFQIRFVLRSNEVRRARIAPQQILVESLRNRSADERSTCMRACNFAKLVIPLSTEPAVRVS